jgi:hypothetical protein
MANVEAVKKLNISCLYHQLLDRCYLEVLDNLETTPSGKVRYLSLRF